MTDMAPETMPDPDVKQGLDYWATQPASYDGVLGGFGTGSLPRVDALGSRQFLMSLMPELCTVPSPLRALKPLPKTQRLRALDVGAGVGRVTSDTLLPLVDDVVLLEPVDIFILEALARGKASESEVEVNGASENTDANAELGNKGKWKGIPDKTKSVTFVKGTLQALDPARPDAAGEVLGRVGFPLPATSASASNKKDTEVSEVPEVLEMHSGFDVIWCQWCLGHLSDEDLVAFFKRAQKALRTRRIEEGEAASLIVVKENLCSEGEDGQPKTVYDEEDSSLTRSDLAWKRLFKDAGLTLVREQTQGGFPDEIYEVKMYALRPATSA